MEDISSPIIYKLDYTDDALSHLESDVAEKSEEKYILKYPTVYIVNDKMKDASFSVYIGETSNIVGRTKQHLYGDSKSKEEWKAFCASDTSSLYVIGHDHFNKSLTLDIENKLMQYMSSISDVKYIHNRRSNQQNEYYTSNELDSIFSKIWCKLREKDKRLFPLESIIKDSALFKASPFHKLTQEQYQAQEKIILKIMEALSREQSGQLIVVEGEAGSGKTVLMSSLFYELNQLQQKNSENVILKGKNSYLLVNHDQQLTVYQQIASKLGIISKGNQKLVSKPTTFINNHTTEEKVDVVIVDEAHLLWTQGKQSYQGENQLQDLIDRARVVVAIFDRNQILSREQYWEQQDLLELFHNANLSGNHIYLNNQLRIHGDISTVKWIRNLIDHQEITSFKPDSKQYDLSVFDSPAELFEAIKQKNRQKDSDISRVLATFDWEYKDKKKPDNERFWNVQIDDWSLPWNLQLPKTSKKRSFGSLAWAEQEQTIDEVGSTFTIQGFDLNFAGVIIGPSVKYRNGKIVFDKSQSKNKKAVQNRTLKDGSKEDVSEFLLKNELNVLLTRGVNGLYLFAVDKELQAALKKAVNGGSNHG